MNRRDLLEQIGVTKKESEITNDEWCNISAIYDLSEEFIREFSQDLKWRILSLHQNLNENSIREFQEEMSWYLVSKYQKLSEGFIREFQLRVSWIAIQDSQDLTDYFLIEFNYKINWNEYFRKHKASFNIIKKFISKANIKNLSDIDTSQLTYEQKQTIDDMLILKNLFKNKDSYSEFKNE